MFLLRLDGLAPFLYYRLVSLSFRYHFLIGHLVHLFVPIGNMLRPVIRISSSVQNGRLRSVYESVRGDNIECACKRTPILADFFLRWWTVFNWRALLHLITALTCTNFIWGGRPYLLWNYVSAFVAIKWSVHKIASEPNALSRLHTFILVTLVCLWGKRVVVRERVSHIVRSILKSDSDAHYLIIVVILFGFVYFGLLEHLFILCYLLNFVLKASRLACLRFDSFESGPLTFSKNIKLARRAIFMTCRDILQVIVIVKVHHWLKTVI